jgi:LPS-assembly protein
VLSSPIPLSSYLEARAEIGFRDTLYFVQTYGDGEFDEDTTQNRFLGEFEADIATTWEKDFFADSGPGKVVRHQFRPYTRYGYIPEVDQDDLPQLDGVDFVGERNSITYGIDNFFNRVTPTETGFDTLAEAAYFQIEQSYDLRSEASDEPFSDLFAKLRWKPFSRTRLEYKTFYDVYDSEFNSHTFESRVSNSRGDFLRLDYSFKNEEDIDQFNAGFGATVFDRWLLAGSFEHSIANDETNNARGSITYQALCWSVSFETRYQPAETSYFLLFNLANIGVPLGIGI